MITLYHGSDYKFNRFEFKNVGKSHGTTGAGFGIYLTDSKANAMVYGKYIYTVQFTPTKSISNNSLYLSQSQVEQILTEYEKRCQKKPRELNSYVENWALTPTPQNIKKVASKLISNNNTDTELIGDIVNATGCLSEVMSVLVKLGYNHTVDVTTPVNEYVTNYCVYDLKSMKIVNREQPLSESVESVIEDCEEIIFDTLFEAIPNELQLLKDSMERAARTKTLSEAQGRAKSKSQRRLMAMALAYKRGKLPAKYASDTIKKLAADIEQSTLHDFAKTNQKRRRKDGSVGKRNNIPDYVKGSKYKK